MTITKEDNNSAGIVVTAEPDTDASMVTATAVAFEEKPTTGGGVGQGNEAPIPPGHARFYCSKCRAVRENDYSHDICVGSRGCFCVWQYREDVVWIYCYCSHIFFCWHEDHQSQSHVSVIMILDIIHFLALRSSWRCHNLAMCGMPHFQFHHAGRMRMVFNIVKRTRSRFRNSLLHLLLVFGGVEWRV